MVLYVPRLGNPLIERGSALQRVSGLSACRGSGNTTSRKGRPEASGGTWVSESWPRVSRQQMYKKRLDRIRDAEREYRERRNHEMVAFFKTQIAEYMVASRDAAKLGNPEIEELIRDRQLNLFMLRRWRKYLAETQASNDPVFRAWHAMAAGAELKPSELPGAVAQELQSSSAPTLKDLAAAYAAALLK